MTHKISTLYQPRFAIFILFHAEHTNKIVGEIISQQNSLHSTKKGSG
jgi:hypothetical protein